MLIPWIATNEEHPLRILIEDADGQIVPPDLAVMVTAGRPPFAVPGQSFRAIIAINGAWQFPKAGAYRAVAELAGERRKTTVFYVSAVGARSPAR